jgi:hypothetical protein
LPNQTNVLVHKVFASFYPSPILICPLSPKINEIKYENVCDTNPLQAN